MGRGWTEQGKGVLFEKGFGGGLSVFFGRCGGGGGAKQLSGCHSVETPCFFLGACYWLRLGAVLPLLNRCRLLLFFLLLCCCCYALAICLLFFLGSFSPAFSRPRPPPLCDVASPIKRSCPALWALPALPVPSTLSGQLRRTLRGERENGPRVDDRVEAESWSRIEGGGVCRNV